MSTSGSSSLSQRPADRTSRKDFALGNMADDLLELTLTMCGKDEHKTPRFPVLLYNGYVSEIISAAVTIHKDIIMANEMRLGENRIAKQQEAAATCVWLNHLIRAATYKGWISEKQRDRWQGLVSAVKFKVINWMQADKKRM